jgi:hypothetical protein
MVPDFEYYSSLQTDGRTIVSHNADQLHLWAVRHTLRKGGIPAPKALTSLRVEYLFSLPHDVIIIVYLICDDLGPVVPTLVNLTVR